MVNRQSGSFAPLAAHRLHRLVGLLSEVLQTTAIVSGRCSMRQGRELFGSPISLEYEMSFQADRLNAATDFPVPVIHRRPSVADRKHALCIEAPAVYILVHSASKPSSAP